VTDYFAALNEPRRPWLDADALKKKFHAISAEAHPDRAHQLPPAERESANRRYADLNAAYNCLRDPKQRLRHLLELERGNKPAEIQTIPESLMPFFMEVGRLCRDADAFITEKAKITSPVLQVEWFERGHEWTEKIQSTQKRVQERIDELMAELKEMNGIWKGPELPLARLEEIYRLFGYLGRWVDQLGERIVKLSL
jgi:curved DNA-binding protein CbpA